MGSIIKVDHLSYVYNPGMPNAVTALDDVSFEVEEGDFVGIIGATGSGKSTLITHMNGLNKPTSGHIIIDGRDLWAEPEKIREFRFLTGLVFQYPEYQLFEETCYKDIAFGPRNMGLDEAEIDRRVHEAADFVGLDEALLQRSPFELSGGQKRRVAVAGVMAMKPRILVLDEPAAGLDPEGRDEILSEVKEYHKDRHHRAAGLPQHGGYCQIRRPCAGDEQQEDRHVRHRGECVRPCARAAGAGPERAAGHKDLPQAAGDGCGCPGGCLHRALRRQDDFGSQEAPGRRRKPCAAPRGCKEGRRCHMLRDITIGQHFPGDSLVHKFDPA